MEILERIWELISNFFTRAGREKLQRGITSLFGSSNARHIKKLQPRVEVINALEPKYQALSDEELKSQTAEFRRRLSQGRNAGTTSWTTPLPVCREAGRPLPRNAAFRRPIDRRHGPAHVGRLPKW